MGGMALQQVQEKIFTQVVTFLVKHFGRQLAGKRVTWFINYDGARDSSISGASASLPSMM